MTAETLAIPEGFLPMHTMAGFVKHNGGFHVHGSRPVLATRIDGNHLNPIRIVHGGYLATVADTAFGFVLKRDLQLDIAPVTVSLNMDYLGAVKEGDWLEAEVEVLKAGRSFINASCLLRVGERLVLRAAGVFVVWKGEAPAEASLAGLARN